MVLSSEMDPIEIRLIPASGVGGGGEGGGENKEEENERWKEGENKGRSGF